VIAGRVVVVLLVRFAITAPIAVVLVGSGLHGVTRKQSELS
jgi:hypothetical protein